MVEAGSWPPATRRPRSRATRSALPFADGTFDRVIASEVLEHIPDDTAAMRELARVLRPGGAMAVTVPRCVPEAINWALSDEYHDTPGRSRPHLPALDARTPAELGRARADGVPPRARAPHALLVAALPRRAVQRVEPRRRRLPQGAGLGHRPGAAGHPRGRSGAQPADRQEPGALPDQARRRRGRVGPDRRPAQPSAWRAGAARADPDPGGGGMTTEDIRSDQGRAARGARHPLRLGRPGDGPRHRRGAAPRRDDPVVRGRPLRPVEPRRGGHGTHRVRPGGRGGRRLPLAGRPPAVRRQLVQLLPGRHRQGPAARHQRVRLPGRRRLAPPPHHRRRGVPGRALADD